MTPVKVRLLSYNIRYGGRGREQAIASVIRAANPDIVVLQEATDHAVVERLSHLTALPTWDSRTNYSIGFLTRLPVEQYNWHRPRGSQHAFLEVAISTPDMRIFGLHLSAWFANWVERRRHAEIRALVDAIREHQDGFHFIAGDFNALAPGEALQSNRMPYWIQAMVWLSGRDIARDTIQFMLDQGYIDVWRALHEKGEGYTFPTRDPHVRLDYIFTPQRYRDLLVACEVQREPAETNGASDHFPLLLDLDIPD